MYWRNIIILYYWYNCYIFFTEWMPCTCKKERACIRHSLLLNSIHMQLWIKWTRLCKLQKGCTRLAAASDKVDQFLAHDRWFSPASSTTKTGRHDIAEILLKVALNTINQIKSNQIEGECCFKIRRLQTLINLSSLHEGFTHYIVAFSFFTLNLGFGERQLFSIWPIRSQL
jgi:hypothetical protein